MAFIRKRGKTKTMHLPVTTSQAFTLNALVKFSSGLIAPETSGGTAATIFGIIKKAIASTDSDYASSRLVPVEVTVEKHVEFEADVNSGLLSTDLGTEYDLASSTTVDHANTTNKVFKVTRYISATKAWGFIKMNGSY